MSDAIQEEELPHDLLHKLLSIEIEINKNLIEPQECNNFDTTIKIKSEKQMNIAKKEAVSLKQLIWKSNLQLPQLDSINGVQLFALVTPYLSFALPASHLSWEAALCQFSLIQTKEVLTTKLSQSSPCDESPISLEKCSGISYRLYAVE
jgi:hypothetical protein